MKSSIRVVSLVLIIRRIMFYTIVLFCLFVGLSLFDGNRISINYLIGSLLSGFIMSFILISFITLISQKRTINFELTANSTLVVDSLCKNLIFTNDDCHIELLPHQQFDVIVKRVRKYKSGNEEGDHVLYTIAQGDRQVTWKLQANTAFQKLYLEQFDNYCTRVDQDDAISHHQYIIN